MSEDEIRRLIRSHAEKAGSIRALAKQWRISQAYLDKQLRGTQSIGDKLLRKLGLFRRKTYEFYSSDQHGLDEMAAHIGQKIVEHDRWREEQGFIQREPGMGFPITMQYLSRLLGLGRSDIAQILRADTDFPKPDSKVGNLKAWKSETIYRWLRQKAKRVSHSK